MSEYNVQSGIIARDSICIDFNGCATRSNGYGNHSHLDPSNQPALDHGMKPGFNT